MTQLELSKLEGMSARLWSFSPTHDVVTFEVSNSNGKAMGNLIFAMCERIESPVWFRFNSPTVNKTEVGVIFEDGPVRIDCNAISWQPYP